MSISECLSPKRILIDISPGPKSEVLRRLIQVLESEGVIRDVEGVLSDFLEREAKGSTGIGNGIAIPHIRSDQAANLEYVFANCRGGVDFESLDGEKVHIILLMMAPKDSHGAHIKALARVSRILNDETTRIRLAKAEAPGDVITLITEREEEIGP